MWWVRKLYQLPPTDPRFLALTPEQIEIEYEHFLLDHPELAKERYSDPEYDEWENTSAQEDAQIISDYTDEKGSVETYYGAYRQSGIEPSNEWEDVEIDTNPSD